MDFKLKKKTLTNQEIRGKSLQEGEEKNESGPKCEETENRWIKG